MRSSSALYGVSVISGCTGADDGDGGGEMIQFSRQCLLAAALITLSLLSMVSCRNDEIKACVAAKEEVPVPGTRAFRPEITWTAPEGWKEAPANPMQAGSFVVEGDDGRKADISIVPLSGNAGGNLANVNRARVIAAILPKGGTTWFFKMAGEDSVAASAKDAFKKFVKSARPAAS